MRKEILTNKNTTVSTSTEEKVCNDCGEYEKDCLCPEKKKWKMEYNNDTGPEDAYLYEWTEVTDGDKVFKCDNSQHAEWLCGLLNKHDS